MLTTSRCSRSGGLGPKRRISCDVEPLTSVLCFDHRPNRTYTCSHWRQRERVDPGPLPCQVHTLLAAFLPVASPQATIASVTDEWPTLQHLGRKQRDWWWVCSQQRPCGFRLELPGLQVSPTWLIEMSGHRPRGKPVRSP